MPCASDVEVRRSLSTKDVAYGLLVDRLKIHYVKGHADNAGNNEADKLAQDAARSDEFVPARRDWDMERIALEKKPPIPAKGPPAAVKVSLYSRLGQQI